MQVSTVVRDGAMERWWSGKYIRILVKLADVDGKRERMKQMQSQRTDGCKHTYMVIYASMKKSIVRNECSTKKALYIICM